MGAVYAPYATINVNGGKEIYGSLSANSSSSRAARTSATMKPA